MAMICLPPVTSLTRASLLLCTLRLFVLSFCIKTKSCVDTLNCSDMLFSNYNHFDDYGNKHDHAIISQQKSYIRSVCQQPNLTF